MQIQDYDIPTVNDKGLFVEPETYGDLTGTTVQTVERWCREGKITAIKCGRKWRIPVDYVCEQLSVE